MYPSLKINIYNGFTWLKEKNIYYEILLSKFLIKVSKNIQIIKGGVLQLLLKTSLYDNNDDDDDDDDDDDESFTYLYVCGFDTSNKY